MQRTHSHRRILPLAAKGTLAFLIGAAPGAQATTQQFRGVNWSDQRDNFQPGVLYLSGLSSTDTYASASAVANAIIGQFVSKLGTNAVRLPINESTVTGFWSTYTGVIDVALTKGRVILCFWGPASSAPKDMNAFWTMWTTVVNKYKSNPNCYFEVYNEPITMSKAAVLDLYNTWLTKFPTVPRNRIILDGTGYAQNVGDIGNDTRFKDCLLAVHEYSMFGTASWTTEAQWVSHFKGYVGNFADRTVATEWGGPMSTGSKNGVTYAPMDYGTSPTNYFMAYIRAITSQLRDWKMGSFYWPGLRDGDWYSMTTRTGTGANIKLAVSNQSGLERMKLSWADTLSAGIEPRIGGAPPVSLRRVGDRTMRVTFEAPKAGHARVRLVRADGTVMGRASFAVDAGDRVVRDLALDGADGGLWFVAIDIEGQAVVSGVSPAID